MEQLKKRRIYRTEQPKDDISRTDIFYIQEELPRFIPWDDGYLPDEESKFAIGEGYRGKVIWDVSLLPHGIVAGATGGGKTALLRSIAHQGIMKRYNVTVLDLKCGGDFKNLEKYKDLEIGYGPILISDINEAKHTLAGLHLEVRRRLEQFKERDVSNIFEYNALGEDRMIPWLLIIDEAAELLDVKPKDETEKEMYAEIDYYLRTLARMSRAAGVHILMEFIRPDSKVLDGQVKNNLLWRVCGYFADPAASRIVLDNDKATELPPKIKGRFIIGEEETQAYYLPIVPSSARPPREA